METGLRFDRISPDVEESIRAGELPYEYARRLAEDKALAVGGQIGDGPVIIGCDTIVVLGDQILEKPVNEADAARTLSLLSGKMHVVCSALALARNRGVLASGYELTNVYFNALSSDDIRHYIDSGEPMDKAGAYGIQGMGAFLVDRIEGNLDTVVGLPRMLLEGLAGKVLACV
jgi:septum formation protein